jgi:DNA-binding PadR family transcriptional regulator
MVYELQTFSVNYAKQNPEAGELYQSLKKLEQQGFDGAPSKS